MINTIQFESNVSFVKKIADNSIDLLFTDPPYNTTANSWDKPLDFKWFWTEAYRVCKPTAVMAIFSAQPFTSLLVTSNIKDWKHEWIWIKNRGSNFANTVREPFKEHETIQVFSKGNWTYNPQPQERTGTGLKRVKYKFNLNSNSKNYRNFEGRYNVLQGELRGPSSWQKFNVEVGLHPTQKPINLAKYIISTYTNEGDTILDLYSGSGTFPCAAKALGRNFYACEDDAEYYGPSIDRLKQIDIDMGNHISAQKTSKNDTGENISIFD